MVLMRHPGLPEEQTVSVLEQQVPALQRAGWDVVPDPPEEPPGGQKSPPDNQQNTDEAPADAGASALPDKSPRRRSATQDGDK